MPTVLWFCGFESQSTGASTNTQEITALGTNSAYVTTPVHGGQYAIAQSNTQTTLASSTNTLAFNTPTIGVRLWFRKEQNPAATTPVVTLLTSGAVILMRVNVNTTGTLRVLSNGGFTQTDGATALQDNFWHRISVAYDQAAGGVGKVWLDNTLEIDIVHTGAGGNVASMTIHGAGSAAPNRHFFDDILTWDSATQPPDGFCLARQGTTGTSIDDAWPNKTGGATATSVWSDTPPDAATLVDTGSTNSVLAQTMPVSPFSAIQLGHGGDVIFSTDTINACKIAFMGKDTSAVDVSIRRYVDGVGPTDVSANSVQGASRQMSIAYRYLELYFTEATVANLDLYEIGCLHGAGAGVHTTSVHDMWMMVDFLSPPESKTLSLNQTVNLSIAVAATIGAAEAVAERYYPLTLVEITTP
jgi:hypothetical protein